MRSMWLAAAALVVGCAHIAETSQLRAIPLEPPRKQTVPAGKGLGIEGRREGELVRAQVLEVAYCAEERRQRARGVQETTRTAVGQSLVLEWVFGGLFALTGGGVGAYNALRPPVDDANGITTKASALPYAIGIGAAGLALLGGAAWQTASLGTRSEALGERELVQRSPERPCGRKPWVAAGPSDRARVRLTLASGLQLDGEAGPDGAVNLPLPASLTDHLEAGQRATLEVIGDPRGQTRIDLGPGQ